MKKAILLIITILCLVELNAQQKSLEQEEMLRPEAVLVVGNKVISSNHQATIEEFIASPCKIDVVCADTTKSFKVISFKTNINGHIYAHKDNVFREEVKENAKNLKDGSLIIFDNIRVLGEKGTTLVLPAIVMQVSNNTLIELTGAQE